MLSPVALATWIALCMPGADNAVAFAMIMAGSGGNPDLITDAQGQMHNVADLKNAKEERYVGLAQIPLSQLKARGIPVEVALHRCANLAIGWHLWSEAHMTAQAKEPTKWKAVSLAFSLYRENRAVLETPYSKKATDLAIAHVPVAPAPHGSRLSNEAAADRANGQALLLRLEYPQSLLGRAQTMSYWIRSSAE
ncbi:hypothetical protein MASR1M60_18300 [Rhodocyclaceae bacterium]